MAKKPPALPGQIALIAHISKIFGNKSVNSRQINTIIDAANRILEQMQIDHIPAPEGCGYDRWAASDEAGVSSHWLYKYLNMGAAPPGPTEYPHNCADFSRCLIMLKAIPTTQVLFNQLLEISEKLENAPEPWNKLLPEWNRLESLLQENKRAEVSDSIRALSA